MHAEKELCHQERSARQLAIGGKGPDEAGSAFPVTTCASSEHSCCTLGGIDYVVELGSSLGGHRISPGVWRFAAW